MTTKTNTTSRKIKTQKIHVATNRPGAGRMLFAHTIAALDVLGMWKSKPEQRKARTVGAVQIAMGPTALRHHTKLGNFTRDDDGRVVLTDQGLAKFATRAGALGFAQGTDQIADSKIVKSMAAAMRKGGLVEGIRFDQTRDIPA